MKRRKMEEHKAKGRLIAAAPDMLAVLKDALAYLDRGGITAEEWYRLSPEHIGKFRSVINKAEGR